MSVYSKGAERMFEKVLDIVYYKDLSPTYDRDLLLKVTEEKNPGWLERVKQKRKEVGKSTSWRVAKSKDIIDLVYGLDSIIAPGGNDSLRFGFDVTLNSERVEEKKRKLTKYPLWKELRIQKVAVVLLVLKSKEIKILSDEEEEERKDAILEIIFSMDENPEEVQTFTLEI